MLRQKQFLFLSLLLMCNSYTKLVPSPSTNLFLVNNYATPGSENSQEAAGVYNASGATIFTDYTYVNSNCQNADNIGLDNEGTITNLIVNATDSCTNIYTELQIRGSIQIINNNLSITTASLSDISVLNGQVNITIPTGKSVTITSAAESISNLPYTNGIIPGLTVQTSDSAASVTIDQSLYIQSNSEVTGTYIVIDSDTTLEVTGNLTFCGNNNNSIVNNGTINTAYGITMSRNADVTHTGLAGIENTGTITAQLGNIIMNNNVGGDTAADGIGSGAGIGGSGSSGASGGTISANAGSITMNNNIGGDNSHNGGAGAGIGGGGGGSTYAGGSGCTIQALESITMLNNTGGSCSGTFNNGGGAGIGGGGGNVQAGGASGSLESLHVVLTNNTGGNGDSDGTLGGGGSAGIGGGGGSAHGGPGGTGYNLLAPSGIIDSNTGGNGGGNGTDGGGGGAGFGGGGAGDSGTGGNGTTYFATITLGISNTGGNAGGTAAQSGAAVGAGGNASDTTSGGTAYSAS